MSANQIFYTLGKKFNNPNALYVQLNFASTPDFSQSITPLLYDKKFAFGIRLDDGLAKAFNNVFAYLYGGIPDEMNNLHTGIRSTDGCGNDVIWNGDFALNIMGANGDNHLETALLYIKWSTLAFARDMGFGVQYHGYESPAIQDIMRYPDITDRYNALKLDYQNWRNSVFTNLGIYPLVSTPPGGETELFNSGPFPDNSYKCLFKEEGFWALANRKYPNVLGGITRTLDLDLGVDLGNITNDYFDVQSYYPCPYHYTDATGTGETIDDIKNHVTRMHNAQGYHAKQFFTHNITYASDEGVRGGMTFTEFQSLINWLDATYGKTSGLDEILFTSAQTVLEYAYCRLNTTVNEYREGNKIILEIIPPAFSQMRRPALTFKINSDLPVTGISIHNIDKFSQSVLNNTTGIINVEWSNEYYDAADRFVTKLESTHQIADKNYAQFLTNMITVPDLKNSLQARINAVTIIPSTNWLFDFGLSTVSYPADYPYNNLTNNVDGSTLTNLIKDTTSSTSPTITIGSGFLQGSSTTLPASVAGRVANDGYFTDKALRDYFSVAIGTSAIITITGLDNNKKYDFRCLPNRAFNTNETKYTVYNQATVPFSANASQVGRYSATINGNYDNCATILNAIPFNGTLIIKVEGVGTIGYINAMKITEHD